MPEAVLCEPKTDAHIAAIVEDLIADRQSPILFTRLAPHRFELLDPDHQQALSYDADSQTAVLGGAMPQRIGTVAVVAAGTSDHGVAAEAVATLRFSGVETDLIVDVGVAGLWRLEARLDEIRKADIVIAVAGMDAALVSVLGGLVAAPVIGVPTSVGYGVATGGFAALNSALASCAQGVTVVNIDNGFGAACAAVRQLAMAQRQRR